MRKQLIVALGAASLAVSGAVLAAPTLVGTTTNASGIDGVVVDSVTYDVTFSTSSFGSTFSTFSGAQDASFALAADLNALSVTGLSNGGASGWICTSAEPCGIWVGSSNQLPAVNFNFFVANHWSGGGQVGGSPGCVAVPGVPPFCAEAAHWTAVTTGVPEPATLSLLGLGIAGIGLARRKPKN